MDKAELFMVAYAAAIPNQHGTVFKPREGASSCVIDQPLHPDGPTACFSLSPRVVVGSLDDIIADFGQKLREAAAALRETQHVNPLTDAEREKLRELYSRRAPHTFAALIHFSP